METNNPKNNMRWVAVAIMIVAVVVAVVFLLPKQASSKYKNLDAFAQCLTNKGATMYGAYWCSHCKAQKAEFGDSFKYVSYVECTEKPDECAKVGVTGYPTWKIASTTLEGEQPLERLVDAGCVLEKK